MRGLLPKPDFESVNGVRAWQWATILEWAGKTGHLVSPTARAEYEERFGKAPVEVRRGGPVR
jgi:hypothetical protein